MRADLRHADARRALAGVDLLFHLGFQLWAGRGRPDDMRAANLEGTTNLLDGRPQRVVLASSAAVYGAWPDNPTPLTEDHPPRPNVECPYAEHKLAVEAACASTAPTVTLRLGAVLGPHADPVVARSAAAYRLVVPAVRGAREALQFVDEADAVGAFLAAGGASVGQERTAGLVVNLATDDWLDAAGIAAISGGRVVRLSSRALLAAAEVGRRMGLTPFGADRAILVHGPLALANGLAAEVLAWRPTRTSAEVLSGVLGRPARTSSSAASSSIRRRPR